MIRRQDFDNWLTITCGALTLPIIWLWHLCVFVGAMAYVVVYAYSPAAVHHWLFKQLGVVRVPGKDGRPIG